MNKIVRYASDLQLPPGNWPPKVYVEGRDWEKERAITHQGDLVAFVYRPLPTDTNKEDQLHILND